MPKVRFMEIFDQGREAAKQGKTLFNNRHKGEYGNRLYDVDWRKGFRYEKEDRRSPIEIINYSYPKKEQ